MRRTRRIQAFAIALAAVSASIFPCALEADRSPDLTISYLFRYGPAEGLSFEVRFPGGTEGFTVLGSCLDKWPGKEGCGRPIRGVVARSVESDEVLPLAQPEQNLWVVDHRPGERLVVSYDLISQGAVAGELPFVSVQPDHVLFLGDAALLVPEHLVQRPSVAVRYEWDGSVPENWTAASSFALGDKAARLELPLKELLQSVFFWGTAYTYEATLPGQSPLPVVWLRSEPPQKVRAGILEELALIRGAVARYLRQDLDGPAPTVLILPGSTQGVGALALSSSLLFMGDFGILLGSGEGAVRGSITVAHELVHGEPAGSLGLVDGPLSETFLAEAFAELVARRALLRGGLIQVEDWARLVSTKLSEYAAVRSDPLSPGTETADPYVFGDLVLLMIDEEIQRASRARQDILTLLHRLSRQSTTSAKGQEVKWNDFLVALSELTTASFSSKIEDIVHRRSPLRLSAGSFAGCLSLVETPHWSFDVGFDVDRSIEQKRIVGLNQKGVADTAGLREGDVLLEWNVRRGRSDIPVSFVVLRQGHRQTVTYLPRGKRTSQIVQQLIPIENPTRCKQAL